MYNLFYLFKDFRYSSWYKHKWKAICWQSCISDIWLFG